MPSRFPSVVRVAVAGDQVAVVDRVVDREEVAVPEMKIRSSKRSTAIA